MKSAKRWRRSKEMIEVEEIRQELSMIDMNDRIAVLRILYKILDKLAEHEHAVDVLSEWRETAGL